MERKLSIAEFASIVGTTTKTIYERIKNNDKLPVKEQLITVKESLNGRQTSVIVTTLEQIEIYKQIYGNFTVKQGEYYESLTDNNSSKTVNNINEPVNANNSNAFNTDLIDKLLTLNEEFNNRLEQKNTELITVNQQLYEYKSKHLLLEDRQGLYLSENKELKAEIETKEKEINSKDKLIKWLLTVIIVFIMSLLTVITYFVTVNNVVNNSSDITFTNAIESEINK